MAESNSHIQERKKFNKLLKRIARKDETAFKEFCDDYGKFIYAVAIYYVKQKFVADDVIDDVMVRVWKSAVSKYKVDKPLGWLYKVTKNCATDKLKDAECYALDESFSANDKNFDRFISNNAFYGHISSLNPHEQLIFVMKMVRDLTFEEIAFELDKPLTTVSSTYYRALEKIKTKIS